MVEKLPEKMLEQYGNMGGNMWDNLGQWWKIRKTSGKPSGTWWKDLNTSEE
jgi:hypothetical protein